MLRFGLWIAGLSLVMAAFIFGGMLWGRAHPGPDELQAAGFDVCDGNPCFMGITPGKTSWDKMRVILGSKESDELGDGISMEIGDITVDAIKSDDGYRVGSLVIEGLTHPHETFPPLSHFLFKYGIPCSVSITDYEEELILVYPSLTLQIALDNERVNIDSGLEIIMTYDSSLNFCAQNATDQDYGMGVTPWLGFTSRAKYVAYAANHQQ